MWTLLSAFAGTPPKPATPRQRSPRVALAPAGRSARYGHARGARAAERTGRPLGQIAEITISVKLAPERSIQRPLKFRDILSLRALRHRQFVTPPAAERTRYFTPRRLLRRAPTRERDGSIRGRTWRWRLTLDEVVCRGARSREATHGVCRTQSADRIAGGSPFRVGRSLAGSCVACPLLRARLERCGTSAPRIMSSIRRTGAWQMFRSSWR
jgi:hypothetical protein